MMLMGPHCKPTAAPGWGVCEGACEERTAGYDAKTLVARSTRAEIAPQPRSPHSAHTQRNTPVRREELDVLWFSLNG
jgi:hypothetical protein